MIWLNEKQSKLVAEAKVRIVIYRTRTRPERPGRRRRGNFTPAFKRRSNAKLRLLRLTGLLSE